MSSGSRADSGPDQGDGGGSGPDGGEGAAGLVLEFRGVPALSASIGGDFSAVLDEVRIDLVNVRAVGDAAPGDERTTRDQLRLEWWGADDDDGEPAQNDPVVVSFNEAPPGLYSTVYAEVADYRLQGNLQLPAAEEDSDFSVDDAPSTALAISIPLGGVTLEAGETRRVSIDVACADAVNEVRWDEVTPDGDGNLVVTSSSSQIGSVREKMQAAFGYQGDDAVSSGTL